MCLIFLSLNQHPQYKLVLAANRDEFYHRKTAAAEFWEDNPNVLGGRDLEAMGTWLGITKNGRLGMLTNYRDPKNIDPDAPSRGKLVSDFLEGTADSETYMEHIAQTGKQYNGFNLIAGKTDSLYYYSNYGGAVRKLGTGLFGLSNHLLDTPWPKVLKGKERIKSLLERPSLHAEELFAVLMDENPASDDMLPSTGLPVERERALSSMFIKTTGYGSRCSTVILAEYDGTVYFEERVFDPATFEHKSRTFSFTTAG